MNVEPAVTGSFAALRNLPLSVQLLLAAGIVLLLASRGLAKVLLAYADIVRARTGISTKPAPTVAAAPAPAPSRLRRLRNRVARIFKRS